MIADGTEWDEEVGPGGGFWPEADVKTRRPRVPSVIIAVAKSRSRYISALCR